ncbi:MAG: IS110 family transposase [Candidatus Omnitrophica bacterium]|nr:IS110 family transposase [Candidatus Omnitrophota bacterium]
MNYIGVDLHKDSMTIVGCRENGEIFVKDKIACKCINKIEKFFLQEQLQPCSVAVEAIGFYHWFFDLLEGKVEKFILANPIETRKYSWDQPKTDFKDATKLAILLAGGEFERNKSLSCFIPDKALRTFRELTRQRHNLVCHHTCLVNSARRIFLKNNLSGPKVLTATTLENFLTQFGEKFPEYHRQFLYTIADNLLYNERQTTKLERNIEQFLHLERFQKLHEILTSIPGIGDMVAATLISEIGDFSRFQAPDKLACYCGLVPMLWQSANTVRYGKVTKKGPVYVRRVLVNAAWVSIRQDDKPRRIFNRISKRAGRKKAIVAIARKLLVWSWYLVAEDEKWKTIATSNLTINLSGMTLMRLLKKAEIRDNSL